MTKAEFFDTVLMMEGYLVNDYDNPARVRVMNPYKYHDVVKKIYEQREGGGLEAATFLNGGSLLSPQAASDSP